MPTLKQISTVAILAMLTLPTAADTTWVAAGNVSGVWTVEGSPYMVNQGDIYIPNGDCLLITPGVEILLSDSMSIMVEGSLQAVGTEIDSVRFDNYEPSYRWGHIVFYYADSCKLEYCVFERASGFTGMWPQDVGGAMEIYQTNMNIKHCSYRYCWAFYGGGAIDFNYSTCMIDSCSFFDNQSGINDGGAIYSLFSDLNFTNCIFDHNQGGTDGGAICSIFGSLLINYCLFDANTTSQGGGAITTGSDEVTITNSTFYDNGGNSSSNQIEINGSQTNIHNCIISKTDDGEFALYLDNPQSINISNCCFDSNEVDLYCYSMPQLGQVVTVNSNGDSCDIYSNLFMNTLMNAPWDGDFSLQEESPCIDAGSLSLQYDPDGTISDIGRYYYDQTPETLNPIIAVIDNDIRLNWNAIPNALQYNVYIGGEPYFELATAQQDVTTDTFFIDSDVISEGSRFYKVTIVTE
ncbi:MAG: hypothetical protein H8E46_06240 [FCB group bacterium]|nr:hypothetical protein [FCB group bacterium]